jgi:hypothetical protein
MGNGLDNFKLWFKREMVDASFSSKKTIFFLLLVLGLFGWFTFYLCSLVIEFSILGLIFLFSILGLLVIFLIFFACWNSDNLFFRKNYILFQLLVLLFLSICIASFFSSLFYPNSLPYKIEIEPFIIHNSTASFLSPSANLACLSGEFKNPIENKLIICEILDLKNGINNLPFDSIVITKNQTNICNLTQDNIPCSFYLESDYDYAITAYCSGWWTRYTIFKDVKIYPFEEYNSLRSKRIGLIGAFVVFFMGVFISFIKNIKEILESNKKS